MFNVVTSQQMLRYQSTYHSNYNGIQASSECNEAQSPLILTSLHYITLTSVEQQGVTLHCLEAIMHKHMSFPFHPSNTPTMTQCHAPVEWEFEGWRHINPSHLEDFKWTPHDKVAPAPSSSLVFPGVIPKQRWSIPPLHSPALRNLLHPLVIKHWHNCQICADAKSSYCSCDDAKAQSSHQL